MEILLGLAQRERKKQEVKMRIRTLKNNPIQEIIKEDISWERN